MEKANRANRAAVDRTPGGRRRVPLGIREGGAEWERVHAELADAALRVLAQTGYSDMVVDDVARMAGASKRTVYRHYPTKVDLAVAGIRRLPSILEWGEGQGSVKERLARATATALDREPLFAAVLATALVHRESVPQLLTTVRADVISPRQEAVRVLVEAGHLTGEIRPEVTPEGLWALIAGLMIQHLDGERTVRGRRGASADFNLMWSMIAV